MAEAAHPVSGDAGQGDGHHCRGRHRSGLRSVTPPRGGPGPKIFLKHGKMYWPRVVPPAPGGPPRPPPPWALSGHRGPPRVTISTPDRVFSTPPAASMIVLTIRAHGHAVVVQTTAVRSVCGRYRYAAEVCFGRDPAAVRLRFQSARTALPAVLYALGLVRHIVRSDPRQPGPLR